MSALWNFLKEEPRISYDEENKKNFKRLGAKFIRHVIVSIPSTRIKEKRASYNAGGIAVSGDHSLYIMFENGRGACMFFNFDRGGVLSNFVTFRTIDNLKDYSGGMNQNKEMGILENPIFVAAELLKLGGYGGEEVLDV